jgi:hypothetical protein
MAKIINAIYTYYHRIQLRPITGIADVTKHIRKNTCFHPNKIINKFNICIKSSPSIALWNQNHHYGQI